MDDRTMKAAVVHEFGKPLAIEEVEVPRPGAGEVLVRIRASGVGVRHVKEGDRVGISTDALENVNGVFARMRKGGIEGRVVLDLGA